MLIWVFVNFLYRGRSRYFEHNCRLLQFKPICFFHLFLSLHDVEDASMSESVFTCPQKSWNHFIIFFFASSSSTSSSSSCVSLPTFFRDYWRDSCESIFFLFCFTIGKFFGSFFLGDPCARVELSTRFGAHSVRSFLEDFPRRFSIRIVSFVLLALLLLWQRRQQRLFIFIFI